MEPNPLLPSIQDLLLIGGVVLAVVVVIGVTLAVWLTRRSRARSDSGKPDNEG